jgi:hypothetical protein
VTNLATKNEPGVYHCPPHVFLGAVVVRFLISNQLNLKYMTVIKTSNQDIKLVDATTNHPKFKKVMDLMKGESVETIEDLLSEVISTCRSSSKVL